MRTAAEKKRQGVVAAVIMGLIATVGVAALASGPKPRSVQPPQAGTPTWTLMTYNVNYGLAGDPDTIGAIRDSGADLVLLQETSPAWEQALRTSLSAMYPYMLFEAPRNWVAGGMGVLSKGPLRADPPVPSPVGWFFGWRVEADTALGRVQLLNVHLRPPLSDSSSFAQGYFSTQSDRVQEIDTFLATLKPGLPTFVAGDFNEGDAGDALQRVLARGMENALPQFQPGASTWRWPVGSFTARTRLDHILYDSARMDCFEAKVLQRGRSDHLPVVGRFHARVP